MDGDSWLSVIAFVLLTIGAAYCAAAEISYAAMNKIRVKNYAENGDKRAMTAMYISNNFDQALTTLLISNNVMHIGFGSLAALISTQLWGVGSVKYTSIIAAVFVFLVSEMIPKSYAKANSEKFALAVAGSLHILMRILFPVAFIFMSMSQAIAKFFPENKEPTMTEEELYEIIDTAREEGVLDQSKKELVYSALKFDVTTVGEIYTKINNVIALDINSTQQEVLRMIKKHKYSRLPIYEDNIDNIIGILHVRKFLKVYIKQGEYDIRRILLTPHFVSKDTPIDELLREMSSKKIHMSIVKNDYGKTIGIVTIEDILEELVGEIWDEKDIFNDEAIKTKDTDRKNDEINAGYKNTLFCLNTNQETVAE